MRLDADAVLSLGLAAAGPTVTPERTAVNCMDARIPDNAGNLPRDQAILADGPAALFSWRHRKMEVALTEGSHLLSRISRMLCL